MKAGPDVSIIVAAYNAENTIERCLDSIAGQSKKEFEVLLIDDGSADDTGKICDGYSERDSRFNVFHNSNHGIGYTRQFGLDHAQGKYVIHVDSDDWIESDMIKLLYEEAESGDFDMVICDIFENYGSKTCVNHQVPTRIERKSLVLDVLIDRIQCGPCNKLIRKECIIQNDVRFPDQLNFGEDFVFIALLLNKGISVSFVPFALYHYEICANPQSASKKINRYMLEQKEKVADLLRAELTDPEYDSAHIGRLIGLAYYSIRNDIYEEEEYYSRYQSIESLHWKRYSTLSPLAYRIIVWSSFHLSYRFAKSLSAMKEAYRSLIKR